MMPKACSVSLNAAAAADVDAAVAAARGLRLMGAAWREVAGSAAAAAFDIVNGATGNAAGKVFPVEVAANGSGSVWFGPNGINCPLGLSLNVTAGTVDVILYYLAD